MRNIYVWPDYSWCDISKYPHYEWRGDDWCLVQVPEDRANDVDNYLEETRPQDFPKHTITTKDLEFRDAK